MNRRKLFSLLVGLPFVPAALKAAVEKPMTATEVLSRCPDKVWGIDSDGTMWSYTVTVTDNLGKVSSGGWKTFIVDKMRP